MFILGARRIANGFDLNFRGRVSAAIFSSFRAPPMFSVCVLDCLESLTADTSVAVEDIVIIDFNVTTRMLALIGPAPPSDFEAVLQTLEYLNRAPSINVQAIEIEVNDGVDTTVERIYVQQGGMRRRRSLQADHVISPLRQLHAVSQETDQENSRASEHHIEADRIAFYWPAGVVALSVLVVAMAVIVWGMKRQRHSSTLV